MARRTTGLELQREYEGEDVLEALLLARGCAMSVPQVKARLRAAIAQKAEPRDVFPTLFDSEPQFTSPEEALRLYSNLFGLWDRMVAGLAEEPPPLREREPKVKKAPLARPGPIAEGPLPEPFVEAAWRFLEELHFKERDKLRHRFDNTQPELVEHLRYEAGLSEAGGDTADILLFELWSMLELAHPAAKLDAVMGKELQAALANPASVEPALERYIDEAVELAASEEEDALPRDEAVKVSAFVKGALKALLAARRR